MSSYDHIKQPLNKNLEAFAKGKANDQQFLQGKSYPCTVTEVVSSGIVTVKFEVNATPWTLPKVTVPVLYPEYIRYPIQVGDKGLVVSASVRLGGISGLGSGVPDLSLPGNLAALAFMWIGSTEWSDPVDPNAVELYGVGTSGVVLRSGDATVKVTLSADGIVIDTGGQPITVNGGGDVTVNDGGDVIAGSVSLLSHTHGGVQTGSGDTGPPT